MKKTFRLAAVLVTLAALVMVSCQNAAGGSGGGGVTPSPTPPAPEPAKLVDGDAIQFVGSYEIDKFARLILGPDGNGVLNFSAPSASTRSILLDDYPFKWEITKGDENVEIEGLVSDNSGDVDEEDDVTVPYLKLTFEEGANVKVTGTIKYLKNDGAGKTDKSGEFELDDGFPLNIDYVDVTNGVLSLSDYDMTGTDPVFNGTILPGILGTIEIDGVEFEVKKSSGDPLEPNPPKAADVVGVFELYSETDEGTADTADETADYYKLALAAAYNTINGFDATKDISADGEYSVASGKDKADAIPVFIPAVIDVKAGGGVADVTVVIFDGANITSETEFKDDEYKLVYVPFDSGTDPDDDSDDTPEEAITVKKMALLADNPGFATGVIEGCRVEIGPDGKIGINKIMDGGGTTDYLPLFEYDNTSSGVTELTPYIPFASIEKSFAEIGAAGDALGNGTPAAATLPVLYKKAAVTN